MCRSRQSIEIFFPYCLIPELRVNASLCYHVVYLPAQLTSPVKLVHISSSLPPHIRNFRLFPSHRLHIFSLSTMIRHIQKRPMGSVAIPLFLFHDASGTISSYYNLGPLGRDVYAIPDARMESDTLESIQEKSRRHCAAIKSLVQEGRILLGGKRHAHQ
jgi:hypothetical protein